VQHRLAYVLTGMGLSERDKIWAAPRMRERSCRTRFPLLGGIAELPENADEPPPRDLRGELRHYLKLEHTLPSDQTKQCLGLRGPPKFRPYWIRYIVAFWAGEKLKWVRDKVLVACLCSIAPGLIAAGISAALSDDKWRAAAYAILLTYAGLFCWLESKCREVEQERLTIIRNNCVSIEYVRGLSKRQIIGYLLEVPTAFPLLHPDALEQESLSCHLHTHIGHIPVAWDNFCLPNFKVASLVQVSKQAESEFNVLCETTIKRSQSLLFAVDPHLAFHVVENASLQGGRMKIRVWYKVQLYQVSVTTRVVEYKRIRQQLEQPSSL